MRTNKTLQKLIRSEEKNNTLPPSSIKDAAAFSDKNMESSVFYSNLLENNSLSRESAMKEILEEKHDKRTEQRE